MWHVQCILFKRFFILLIDVNTLENFVSAIVKEIETNIVLLIRWKKILCAHRTTYFRIEKSVALSTQELKKATQTANDKHRNCNYCTIASFFYHYFVIC